MAAIATSMGHPFGIALDIALVGCCIRNVQPLPLPLRLAMVSLLCCALPWLTGCRNSQPPDSVASDQPSAASPVNQPDSSADLLAVARRAISRKDFVSAESVLRDRLIRFPDDPEAFEMLGDISLQRGNNLDALTMYRDARRLAAVPSQSLLDKLVEQSVFAGQPFDAIDLLFETLELYPDHPQARYDLAGLSTMLGIPQTAVTPLRWLMQRGRGDPDSLLVLSDPDQVQPYGEMCQQWLDKSLANGDGDRRAGYGLAVLAAGDLKWGEVIQRLAPVIEMHPDFIPAQTLYGRALRELGRVEELTRWSRKVPSGAETWPPYWVLLGLFAQDSGQHEEAARAFWESLRLNPIGQPEAVTGLVQSLEQIGRREHQAFLQNEVRLRAELRDAIKIHLERSSNSQSAALGVAEVMAALGRLWEAEAWGRLAVSLPNERVADVAQRYLAIRNRLTTETPWQLADATVANRVDLSDLAMPQWSMQSPQIVASGVTDRGTVRFEDQANKRGLVHTCEVTPAAQTEGHWIYHSLGGGVGVIDLDLDGWPDLALAMLDGKPMQADSSPNRLFRNLAGQFVDITEASDYEDRGFTHGIAIGDYNEDGFPDIFAGNYGQNRLYRNNGDGTFQDVTDEAGIIATGWSTSVVIADVDGDGIADLFETHYCGGKLPLERACKDGRGLTGTCPPLHFAAEPDRVWRGVGDGTFVDATDQWMDQTSPGRGLGVVVGQFDENPGIDIYVANDMTANHLWSATSSDESFRLVDLGVIRGLALNSKSLSQASMGIAVGDPNGDGLIDLFVTHFSNDYNTYYEQVRPGFWADRSAISGLALPSIKMLGFGTQWYDFDNHGKPELFIANGHVDNVQSEDVSYRMPPQLFRLADDGKWVEPDRAEIGEYFMEKHLGRAVATVDINRDGLGDIVITHLYDPVALLVNNSQQTGDRITIELKAQKGSRDAIGTTLTMDIEGRKHHVQLTAGDGYLASNQRLIVIGMGDSKTAREIVIRWPSGTEQKIDQLVAGCDYLVIEGDEDAFQWGAR